MRQKVLLGHALAEHLIKKHLKQQTRRPVSDYYSDDLLEAVDDYVSFVVSEIEAARKECPDPIFSVEQRVDVSDYAPDCFGTADMVIVTDKLVHIIDLKLGKGVPVYAEKKSTADDLWAWDSRYGRDALSGGNGAADDLPAKILQFQHMGDPHLWN